MEWVYIGAALGTIAIAAEAYLRYIYKRPLDTVRRCRACGRFYNRLGLCAVCSGKLEGGE